MITITWALGAIAGCGVEGPTTADSEPRVNLSSALQSTPAKAPGSVKTSNDSDAVAPDPSVQQLGTRSAVAATGTRSLAVIVLDFGDTPGPSPQQAAALAFTNPDSMAALFRESSFGALNLEGEVLGPLRVDPIDVCDLGRISAAGRAAAEAANVDLEAFDHWMFVHPFINGCRGGWGEVGTPAQPSRQTWINGALNVNVLAHEIGHNLGLQHAGSYDCGTTAMFDPGECVVPDEYGDPYDPMGNSGVAQFSAYAKAAEGWFDDCNVVRSPTDGVFEILPIETNASGIHVLRVPMRDELCPSVVEAPCYYYLEYRQPIGVFDGGVHGGDPIHQGVTLRIGGELDPNGTSGLSRTLLLDATPNSTAESYMDFRDARLGTDRVFRDSFGLRLRVRSLTSARAVVALRVPGGIGAAECLDGTPLPLGACNNGVRDPGESDVDCGGACAPCDAYQTCTAASDCWSNDCAAGVCQPEAPACDDGFRNGNETDVDCGGTCGDCDEGGTCSGNADCQSGLCSGGFCTSSTLRGAMSVTSDWAQGFCVNISLTNTSNDLISRWHLGLRMQDASLQNTWGGVFTQDGDGLWEVTSTDATAPIWPRSSVSLGFCANKTGPNYLPQLLWVAVP